jgi:tRNA (adenine57-N1/adenine58-N1)-methyltransferase
MPEYGDLFILVNPKGRQLLRRLERGRDVQGGDGVIAAESLLGLEYGSELLTRQGVPFRLKRPGLYDLLRHIKRQTQIIYPKDIAYICLRLGVGNGKKIIEAGSGSGGLTLALSWFSGEKGRVFTYEAREEFFELCRRNLEWAGLGENVTQYKRDIAEGFEQTDADALFLDVRTPWDYLDQAQKAVKPGAPLAFLLPTVDQVGKLLLGLERGPFDEVEVEELLIRRWKPVAERLRPEDRMVAHTGFLVFARQQIRTEKFEQARPRGTRELKQEASRRLRTARNGLEEAGKDLPASP